MLKGLLSSTKVIKAKKNLLNEKLDLFIDEISK